MTCDCGRELSKKLNDVTTKYKEKQITVSDVPVFVCSSGHTKIPRETRISLKNVLKTAYDENTDEITFPA
jgi:YgiT-type zinc finger domain-containing protein